MGTKTLRLTDLFVVGKDIEIKAPEGTVKLWLQKLNPVDNEQAMRRANAKRSACLAMIRFGGKEEERKQFLNELFDIAPDNDAVIEFLAQDRVSRIYLAREAEVADSEEWSKDDYLQGLKDAWNDEMYERFVADPTDQEALTVSKELERFQAAVNKEIKDEHDSAVGQFKEFTPEKLSDLAIDKLIENRADMEWLTEYRKCEVWLGVREPKTHSRYFSGREEVDLLSGQVLGELLRSFAALNIDVIEGKGSGEAQDS